MLNYSRNIGSAYVISSTLITILITLLILGILMVYSLDALWQVNLGLFTLKWLPSQHMYGILPMLFGTCIVTLLALVLAAPLGLLTAIFTSEFASKKYRFILKAALELLAGIPSIIYGLIGIAFFSTWIQDWFNLQSGRTILTAGILLALMVLPTVITLVDDALQSIPTSYREAAKGLGFYNYEVIRYTLLPIVKSDIIAALLLATGRALGETMAVMLVIGSIDKIPTPLFNLLSPGQTITSKLGREIAETALGSVHFSALIFMGGILLVVVLFLTIFTQLKFKPKLRLYE